VILALRAHDHHRHSLRTRSALDAVSMAMDERAFVSDVAQRDALVGAAGSDRAERSAPSEHCKSGGACRGVRPVLCPIDGHTAVLEPNETLRRERGEALRTSPFLSSSSDAAAGRTDGRRGEARGEWHSDCRR
jgi:hypothetical protein